MLRATVSRRQAQTRVLLNVPSYVTRSSETSARLICARYCFFCSPRYARGGRTERAASPAIPANHASASATGRVRRVRRAGR